jgi:hypothetical protein
LRDDSGSEAKFEALVRSYQERFPWLVTVLDARRELSAPDMFVDATHLSGQGAVAVSRSVARILKAARARGDGPLGPRWIALQFRSGDREPVAELALEDLEQSSKALGVKR